MKEAVGFGDVCGRFVGREELFILGGSHTESFLKAINRDIGDINYSNRDIGDINYSN